MCAGSKRLSTIKESAMNLDTHFNIQDNSANPAPLGLLAFGMTTVLLNFHNAGIYELNSMVLAMGIFYGGLAQVIAGIMEWKKNNTFGLTAFASYGFFWLTLVALIVMPKLGWVDKTSETALAFYTGNVGNIYILPVHRYASIIRCAAGRIRHIDRDYSFCLRSVLGQAMQAYDNLPAMRESFAAHQPSIPASPRY